MIGIDSIGTYISEAKRDNNTKLGQHGVTPEFLADKIGIKQVARKETGEKASDLCVLAYQDLLTQAEINPKEIGCICVCTQNGDYTLPHTSAIVHGLLQLDKSCAAFDLGLGCSGYPYGLHIVQSFMEANGLKNGLFFTSDPYSDVLDPDDKNTDLLFGDAATVTFLTRDGQFVLGKGIFETYGEKHTALIHRPNEFLYMNGREIFNFVMRYVPTLIEDCLNANQCESSDVDYFLLHQASKFLIDQLVDRCGLTSDNTPFQIEGYGNTVSSSIPILLKDYLRYDGAKQILLCGFGVGLSMSATVLRRNN